MKLRKLLAAAVAVLLLLILPVNAAAEEPPDSLVCIQNILQYYEHYGAAAEADLDYWLSQLREADPGLGDIWEKILIQWSQLDAGQEILTDTVPSGLRGDDSVCFIVFGYRLNSDSTISSELLGRTQVALQAAKTYPNALIICTGSNTGSTNKVYSEAWRMYEYLVNHGVDKDRIVIENKARNATENVLNSFAILTQEHPEVRQIAFITSDYMIPRAQLLLYAQSLYAAAAAGTEPLEIVGYGASDPYNPGNETRFQVAAGLALIAGMVYEDYEDLEAPVLSQLTGIRMECAGEYEVGETPEPTVIAQYDSGITRDVTHKTHFSGLDTQQAGQQILTAEYTEGESTLSIALEITVVPTPTEPPTEETEAATVPPETEPAPAEQPEVYDPTPVVIAAIAAGVALGLLFLFLKKKSE